MGNHLNAAKHLFKMKVQRLSRNGVQQKVINFVGNGGDSIYH